MGITASRAPNSEGTLSRSSLNLGRLEAPKSKTRSVVAELPSPVHPRPLPPTSLPAQARRGPVQRAGEEATGEEVRVPSSRPRQRDRPFLPGGKQPLGTLGGGPQLTGEGRGALPWDRGGGALRAQARGGAGTWEGAQSSRVGAQGPVAHPRHELQAQDLLQEPGRPPAAAAPLVLHPAAIHHREMGESPRSVAVARSHLRPARLSGPPL